MLPLTAEALAALLAQTLLSAQPLQLQRALQDHVHLRKEARLCLTAHLRVRLLKV
jgi:hypothetical protein